MRVSFSAGWVEGPDGPVLAATKPKRRHVVDLDPTTYQVLVESPPGAMQLDRMRLCSATTAARRLETEPGDQSFVRHRRAAGLRPFRLHDLRHFMATEMLHAGVPLVIVSRRLDHRRVSTTLDRYAHAVPGSDAQAAATLWQIMQATG